MNQRSDRILTWAVPYVAAIVLAFAANLHAMAADTKDEIIRKLQDEQAQLKKENEALRQELALQKKIAAEQAVVADVVRKKEAEAREQAQRALDLAKKQVAKFEDQLALEAARAKDLEAKARQDAERARAQAQEALAQAEKARVVEDAARKAAQDAALEAKRQADQAAAERQKARAEVDKARELNERLRAEQLEVTKKLVTTLEQLASLKQEAAAQRARATNAEVAAKFQEERTKELLVRIMELEKDILKHRNKEPAPPGGLARNPPPIAIEGKILEIAGDGQQVEVNLGSDAGLQTGHTLEVFRISPKPLYLGYVRIVKVTTTKSVGQVVGKAIAPLQTGDIVSSRLFPEK